MKEEIQFRTCKMCGAEGNRAEMSVWGGAYWCHECLLENEAFQEYETQMESELRTHRRKNKEFYEDLELEKKG